MEIASLRSHWPSLVGGHVADHCRPVKLREGVLTVVVDHNAWAAELRILSADLFKRASSVVPGVGSIVLKVNPRSDQGW